MSKRYYDESCGMFAEEEDIRRTLLEFETKDILDNLEDYVNGFISIYGQVSLLELACDGDLQEVVDNLNENWGCEFKEEEKYYIDRYTFLSSKVGDLEKQLEDTKREIKEVQDKIHKINGGK